MLPRARGFYELASSSDGTMRQEEAAMVSFAFATELALKAMNDRPAHGHDLSRLFTALPEATQQTLADEYMQVRGGYLPDDLASCRNIFIELRYYHEKSGYAAPFGKLRFLAKFLIEAGDKAVRDRPDREFFSLEEHFPGGLKLPGPNVSRHD